MEMIVKLSTKKEDVEILYTDKGNEYFKSLSCSKFLKLVNHNFKKNLNKKLNWIHPSVIACNDEKVLVLVPGHKHIVVHQEKSYNINFPNAIYLITMNDTRIQHIEAYSYVNYKGKETKLFAFPMPNMLTHNSICLGTADKKIYNGDWFKTLENIIHAEYTHARVDNVKSFKNTTSYFKYLEKNILEEKLLIDIKKKVKDLLS